LNEFAVDTYGASGPAVLHVSGERDYEALRGRVSRPDYKLVPSLDGLGVAYGAADLALTRSGSTVWELAAAGLPSILVPYPFATGNHQTLNARYFEHGGGAVVVPESELARVPDLVRDVLGDEGRRARMSASMRALAKPDAAKEIAEELIELGRSARR
jgi:UDP-N-acetylglucosamine--N-acetylmuramyl-(pentapeptide) pyrophosphoryl-undecaprenol N-acetylglucosamine transferase